MQKSLNGFYIVATPIGNYEDITFRAIRILKEVDIVLCEDTRITGRLLQHYQIKKSMYCYNDFSDEKAREKIVEKLKEGKTIALVSDAGTPLISDPGYKLVKMLLDEKISVTSIPGPSSVITALTMSGLPTDKFLFEGFLPNKKSARLKSLSALKQMDVTIVFFEAARRLKETLIDMVEIFGNSRHASIIREITKIHEEIKTASLLELKDFYTINGDPKGEIVIVLGPLLKEKSFFNTNEEELEKKLKKLLESMTTRDAVNVAALDFDLPKKIIYDKALKIKETK